jgi:hypothetical protein
MVAAQVVTTRLALHVRQLHQQDMLLPTLAVAVVLVVTILQANLVWHLQIIPVMLSFLVVAAVLVASIHRVRVV